MTAIGNIKLQQGNMEDTKVNYQFCCLRVHLSIHNYFQQSLCQVKSVFEVWLYSVALILFPVFLKDSLLKFYIVRV